MDGPLTTPDQRYIVVRGRLWRTSNPKLTDAERTSLVNALMTARRAIKTATGAELKAARGEVHRVKTALGERGPVWWPDNAPDLTRKLAKNTPYADWYETQPGADR